MAPQTAKLVKIAARSRRTGSQSVAAPRSKKPERVPPGRLNAPRERNGRLSKIIRPLSPSEKPLSLVRSESGGGSSTGSNKAPPLRPQVAHASLLTLLVPSDLVTLIYKCCILPRMNSEMSSSAHALACRKHLFIKHIRLQLIRYFTAAIAKAGNSYKDVDALVAEALHMLGF